MEYREVGKTGLKISALSFGASSLGGVFHSIKESEGIEAVHTAVDNGLNFIDVSPYYGHYKAETVLGKALKEIDRSKYILSTKVGRYGENGVNCWDYSAKKATESVNESMERLNIDFIDLINVHDVEFSDVNQVINETLPALHELKAKGIVGHVGITGLPLELLKYVIENTEKGTVESILSFCHYCLNDDALVDYLDFFEANEVGVINASPLSMGMLTERGAPVWHPATPELKAVCEKAVQYVKSKGLSIEQLAVKYSVSNPRISSTLFSTANPQNVLKNIQWCDDPLDEQLVLEVREIVGPYFRETWENS